MKLEHALRDLYDHESDVRMLLSMEFLFIAVAFVAIALDATAVAISSLGVVIVTYSLSKATVSDGYNRAVWQRLTGGLNGVALETKRDKLEQYQVLEESDLEDLEL